MLDNRADRRRRALAPAVWVLLVAGGFHFYRGAPLDGVVFVAAGALAAGDAPGQTLRARTPRWSSAVAMPATLVLAVALGLLPLGSWVTGVLLAVLGLAALLAALSGGDEPAGSGWRWRRPSRTGLAWTLIALAGCLLELTAYFLGEARGAAAQVPALSDLLQPLIDQPVWRVPLMAGWLLLGLALLRWTAASSRRKSAGRS